MIKLAALNEDWSDDSSCEVPTEERVKEARESEALELYNKALQYQQQGNHDKAREFYNKLLSASFVAEAGEADSDDDPQSNPALAFKYSAYKNLASLAEEQSKLDDAVALYLEAAAIDDTDVTLWYKIGKIAVKVSNVRLARYAFEQGLNCNSKHWPCLDELITVLYAIGDYHSCLDMVSMAFERDTSYPKGLIIRDKIYNEYSSFKNEYQNLKGMSSAKNGSYDQTLSSQIINDALDLRKQNRERNKEVEPDPIIPVKHLALYTWSSLGECLVSLYDQVTSDDNSLTLCQKVNLENYSKLIIPADVIRNLSAQKSFTKDNEDKRSSTSVKRKKPMTMSENDPFNAPKRRSARVNKSKKKQEEINYLEILQEFLPKSLKSSCMSELNDESGSMNAALSQDNRYEKPGVISKQGISSELDTSNISEISSENEPLDVQTFVKKHMDNCGTLDLLCQYANHLKDNCQFKWSASLVEVYLKIYLKIRPHLSLPALFCPDTSKQEIMSTAQLVLVAIELTLDKWCTEKSKSSSSLSPAGSPRGNTQSASTSPLKDQGFHGKYFLNDMEYIAQAAGAATNILEKEGLEFTLRVNWAKVRFMMFQGQMHLAVIYLDRCKALVELSEAPITVHLVNCRADNVITIGQVRKKLESLQRCQSLEEVHRLYESGQYQDVVDVLLSSLHQPPSVTKVGNGGMSIPERPAQLLLLQDSLLKLKEYKTCLSCAEVAFNEAVGQMTPCEAWATTFDRQFHCVDTILKQDISLLDTLPGDKIQRFTQNLIKVIEVSMESAENASDVPLATVMPWILLYRFIASKEDENEAMEVDTTPAETKQPTTEVEAAETSADNPEAPAPVPQVGLPLSLQFLRLAHEALGGRSWCVNNDGLFLLLYVDVFLERLNDDAPSLKKNRTKIARELEQCFFCLYGHPSKKAKARGLQEHGSTQIPLTWANSPNVFNFFKPKVLPTFEDKTNTVTSEVQNLLRRITIIVPKSELEVIRFESVQNYIDGSCANVPALPDNMVGVDRPVLNAIFYLLADSYFKNKEFSKAIKFYIHDICSNPNRFDTWAAMALARQVRLEDKLRACEPKSEGPIKKHSISTLKCFKRALEIDHSNTNLWGEYGSLSYCLHSYASRQLYQVEALTPENKKGLEERRSDMLLQSKKCFNEALHKQDNDEPWLQCYMLGKIAEKLSEPPQEYLEYYLKAMKELDKDDAEYPRKITYHNPPNLALEALEVAFRFHASALKLLMKPTNATSTPNYKVIENYLDQASLAPFFQANLNKDDDQAGTKVSPEKRTEEKLETIKDDGTLTTVAVQNSESQMSEDLFSLGTPKDSENSSCLHETASAAESHNDPISEPSQETEGECQTTTDPAICENKEVNNSVGPSNVAKPEDAGSEKMQVDCDDVCTPPECSLVSTLIDKCIRAIAYCLQRFPQHYKCQYRLANAFLHIPSIKNTKLSRDLLLGSNSAGEKPFHLSMQGLLNEKSKTNLFQGIWRIPLDDVDRPGSFCTHMHKSVKLLIEVLEELREWHSLLLVSSLMYRCPDAGKKYLRDNERLQLASKAFEISLKLLTERFEERKRLSNPNIATTVLLEAYEAYKWSQKVQKHNEETEKLLVNVFKSSALHQDEKKEGDGALLEEVLKHFQSKPQSSSSESDDKPASTTTTSKLVRDLSKEEPAEPTAMEHTASTDEPSPSSAAVNPLTASSQEDSLSCISATISQTTTEGTPHTAETPVFTTPTTPTAASNPSEALPSLIPDQEPAPDKNVS